MLTYSFIQHPLERILDQLDNTFSGVAEAMIIYADYNKTLSWKSYSDDEIEEIPIKDKSVQLQKFRKNKVEYEWLADTYFDNLVVTSKRKKKKIKQLSFTDELENNLLCVKFLSPIDHLYDCLILKIENTSVLGMSKQGSSLTVQEKNIIGKLLFQTFRSRIQEEYNNNDTHRMVLNNINMQQRSIQRLEEENEQLRSNYKKSVLYFINNVLARMSEKFKMNVALTDNARDYILDKDLDISTLEKVLVQAAHMAANLTLQYSSTILIHPENIIINQQEEAHQPLSSNDKHASIIEILDKYEEAAEKAQAKGWKVNGNTVAELCTPSITPSAISFNLKKYKKQINILIDRYEEKWPILRSDFKPLKNILDVPTNELSKYKSA
ncbi:hypothetical protein [Parvicella tangerina]|uniref:Uncharacterized protein n=1 Tax=Parvicella tangerina TaxID=2829795 RepID=A0A916NRQ0_9FLAO|nr:hypothetical protein [Parvicella tangerina]CAG5081748.1 hypothetical protein CRYO30217_01718 [Parvicella tangerina]